MTIAWLLRSIGLLQWLLGIVSTVSGCVYLDLVKSEGIFLTSGIATIAGVPVSSLLLTSPLIGLKPELFREINSLYKP